MALTEQDVRRIMRESMADPLAFPREFKTWLGSYLEINQPAFHLNQLLGWNAQIANNGKTAATATTLTTSIAALTGASATIYNPGNYLVTGSFEFTLGSQSGNSGETNGTSTLNVDRGGNVAWTSTDLALAVTGGTANCALGESDYLELYGFGAGIPGDATVQGVEVKFIGKTTVSGSTWNVQLLRAGNLVGAAKTTAAQTDFTTHTLGTSTDLWSTMPVWTASEINNLELGVAVWATFSGATRNHDVDVVTVTVYGSGFAETLTGYLYVGGTQQSPVLSVPNVVASETRLVANQWYVTTTAASQTAELRAKKTQSWSTATATANSNMIIARLS